MTRPYSEDIRQRALAWADAGETVRSIAEELEISPSCVTKWKNLMRETGGISPGKIGGHKREFCLGQCRLAAQADSLGAIYLAQVDDGTGSARDQDRRPGGLDLCPCRGTEL
ncbi:helix-turn-helix domain-containing protein [Bradyrhizobium sp.]|uniref:helix-turn-helix domain-containing protein n=1 Tax=Bradyrhizobium sp. TaxID=376 RepID=UPI001EB189CB|nr:helix-turn-helix domain-containing protein [Bradyrhizobium sp.]MBV9982118.1 helix-turn-helix domain-containing protein [Bradyrhizobium sp.]